MLNTVIEEAKEKMSKSLEHYKNELKGIRTGRASVAMFEGIKVDYYGTPTPINQVGTLSAPEPRLITIQPWEPSLIPAIEKAIMSSNLGFNPSNDGVMIRVPIPQLTEERRKEIVKLIKKMAEDAKVVIRNIRRDANENIKQLEKDKEISEDDAKKGTAKVQELTDDFIKKVDEVTALKEKDVMEI
ncbi:MAG: ribosome recycling factor [Deferribacterales bacterium]|jgi:ribosome recycling factor|uniref:ribosome recycling factor n=1 Tax=Deferrivibrio essentukiensis TaxID=2880922 RepID=UPI0019B18779|nr:ribosome recycling factor [Deferrivibrio essentukiensis]MBC7195865.1 ribosome recycling factor [Deferribacterales bacterium]MCB4203933.1 ribosome recycling factor [Deferrivibrio essentukiensis]